MWCLQTAYCFILNTNSLPVDNVYLHTHMHIQLLISICGCSCSSVKLASQTIKCALMETVSTSFWLPFMLLTVHGHMCPRLMSVFSNIPYPYMYFYVRIRSKNWIVCPNIHFSMYTVIKLFVVTATTKGLFTLAHLIQIEMVSSCSHYAPDSDWTAFTETTSWGSFELVWSCNMRGPSNVCVITHSHYAVCIIVETVSSCQLCLLSSTY